MTKTKIMSIVNLELSKMLDRLQESYMEKTGLPFQHFYCPILFKDEETELCQAHIVNRKFPGASRKCTVQRKDVDGFYGSNFEADFQEMEIAQDKSPIEIISDRTLAGRFNAKIFVGDKPVEHFFPKQAVPLTIPQW